MVICSYVFTLPRKYIAVNRYFIWLLRALKFFMLIPDTIAIGGKFFDKQIDLTFFVVETDGCSIRCEGKWEFEECYSHFFTQLVFSWTVRILTKDSSFILSSIIFQIVEMSFESSTPRHPRTDAGPIVFKGWKTIFAMWYILLIKQFGVLGGGYLL